MCRTFAEIYSYKTGKPIEYIMDDIRQIKNEYITRFYDNFFIIRFNNVVIKKKNLGDFLVRIDLDNGFLAKSLNGRGHLHIDTTKPYIVQHGYSRFCIGIDCSLLFNDGELLGFIDGINRVIRSYNRGTAFILMPESMVTGYCLEPKKYTGCIDCGKFIRKNKNNRCRICQKYYND